MQTITKNLILLVDDDLAFRRPLQTLLERAGYEVRAASDGREALKLFRLEPFNLVITDLIMPTKEGLETITELKQLKPDLKIIAMSGGGRVNPADYLQMARYLGAENTLAKPFRAADLLAAVARALGQGDGTPPSGDPQAA